ncbi:hypothetical protein ACCO45_003683 [Purpureocillium lilacinum]|uniref:Uncharacterized protein n=1 Tax=Purpureocillium lilacinum TaxID=33203 RepID=A0ACC4E0J2_PURLI
MPTNRAPLWPACEPRAPGQQPPSPSPENAQPEAQDQPKRPSTDGRPLPGSYAPTAYLTGGAYVRSPRGSWRRGPGSLVRTSSEVETAAVPRTNNTARGASTSWLSPPSFLISYRRREYGVMTRLLLSTSS